MYLQGLPAIANPMRQPPQFGREEAVKLHPRIFRFVCRSLKIQPVIDLFASAKFRQLPLYYTASARDPQALGTNAFNFYWDPQWDLYANPPWSLISRVLAKVIQDQSMLLLVSPEYDQVAWMTTLQELTIRHLVWDKPLYLDREGRLRPKPRWNTRFSVVSGKKAGLISI